MKLFGNKSKKNLGSSGADAAVPVRPDSDQLPSHVGYRQPIEVVEFLLDGSSASSLSNGLCSSTVVQHPTGTLVTRVSNGPEVADSRGRTDGFSVELPSWFEAAASGRRVRVIIRASAGQSRGQVDFGVAYSTNDVGNSGWRKFAVGSSPEERSFEWEVPPMEKGNGDFVGILPPRGSFDSVDVHSLRVEVIPFE